MADTLEPALAHIGGHLSTGGCGRGSHRSRHLDVVTWPSLAAFWPHKDAQRCRLLRISEYRFGRSAAERAGSGCARHSLQIRC